MIIKNIIGTFEDTLIKASYKLAICDAETISVYLKKLYSGMNINIDDHNGDLKSKLYSYDKENEIIANNPPSEIYEYQNFFLLQKKTGEYILLDGFRRLLWYKAPENPILVRIYQEDDLNNEKILLLLVYLNHFKFYGGGQYLERGFSLLLKTVFNLNISNYKDAFDGYLSRNETKNNYSGIDKPSKTKHNELIKERILNPFFVSDITFLQAIYEAGFMVNSFVGALTYKKRISNNVEFNAELFIKHLNSSEILKTLMVKYNKVGTNTSAESHKVVNQILEFYEQAFSVISGGNIQKSYAEKMQECKDIIAKLKKDKSLIKITGNSKYWKIDAALRERIITKKEKVRVVCVVYPQQYEEFKNSMTNEVIKYLPYGILDAEMVYLNTTKHLLATSDHYGFIVNNITYNIGHNYSGHYDTGKKYTYLNPKDIHGGNYQNIELFAELPKEIFDK